MSRQTARPSEIGSEQPGCRPGCGACCIAPSISSPIPGMPQGKPAGVRCVQLDDDNLCLLFGSALRPTVCERFAFDSALCGSDRMQALQRITLLEGGTHPAV
ncbi:YkgJ family cysteine cluster protein [Billgrantia kenyensis]|uniref:YkgJ family cysteine cluster protein n=1 Tax=Billgrantia kenyensis TaxID=321266 RepID=A0A7V9VY57_9GAMM|nr:YkgJ family cysteine cluster protein [Halomonas kenyensis]MBA2777613.1 YkgJ family cysteine cluster protein [Halomonas kenyensis]MCG6660283.1 YkgJ family cysteine cluster protein [Halomonas kenyensis]